VSYGFKLSDTKDQFHLLGKSMKVSGSHEHSLFLYCGESTEQYVISKVWYVKIFWCLCRTKLYFYLSDK